MILLVAITVIAMALIYMIRFPMPNPPPTVSFASVNDARYPVWGDPTDCYPNLPHNPNYYLGNGTGNSTDTNRWNTYMTAWNNDCENGQNGTYNLMDAARITITSVSQAIPLSGIEFQFTCVNTTPSYDRTVLVSGYLNTMEWEPGAPNGENFTSSAPTLGTCASYDPKGSGANSVYYNRLGFFDPLNPNLQDLAPGMTLIIYIHTPNSIYEAPNPLEPQSTWNQPDADDYHGAPLWCFTVPGSCSIQLVDTDWSYPAVILNAPVYML